MDPTGPRQMAESAAHAYQTKQFDKAETFALAALMDQPGEPLASEIMGLLRISQKRFDEAIDHLKAGRETAPDSSGLASLMGHAHAGKGDLASAEKYFVHATQAAPDRAKLWEDLGRVAFKLRHWAEARMAFERCLKIDADNEETSIGLAQIELNENAPARALELATRVTAGNPDHLISRHVTAASYLRLGQFEQALASAVEIEQHPNAWPKIKILAFEVAAKACHALGRYDEAFAYSAAMNDGTAEIHRHKIEKVRKLRSFENLAKHIEMTPRLAEKTAKWPKKFDTPAPSHLIGFARSGTSLMDKVLTSHPSIMRPENRPSAKVAKEILLAPNSLEIIPTLTYEDICSFRRDYWNMVASTGVEVPDGTRILELKPYYTQHLSYFGMILPDSKYIFARRDPRDTILSCFQHNFSHGIARFEFLDLERAAHYYDLAMGVAWAARKAFDLDIIEVGYEDFVANPEEETRRIIDFLDLPWSDEVGRFIEEHSIGENETPPAAGASDHLHTSAAYRWRNYESHLEPVRDILDKWAERFGYA